jgi:hypothetical protein
MDSEALPLVAVTVRGMGLAISTAAPVTEMVSVDEPAPVMVAGLKLPVIQVTPLHVSLVAVKVTLESKPSATRMFTVVVPVVVVDVPAPIAPMLIGLGDAITSKDGSGAGATGW